MRRLFISLVCLTAVACGSNTHKIPITRRLNEANKKSGQTGAAKNLAVAPTDAKGKALNDCFDLPAAVKTLTDDKKQIYTVYTSDMDLGTYELKGGAECGRFTPVAEAKVRAAAYFHPGDNSARPEIAPFSGGDLIGSEAGQFLNFASQSECTSVKFAKTPGIALGDDYNVVCKNSHMVTVKAASANVYVQYSIDTTSMNITTFVPVKAPANCAKVPAADYYSKITRTLTWNGTGEKLKVLRSFAMLMNDFVNASPQELSDSLVAPPVVAGKPAPTLPGFVSLSYEAYNYVSDQINGAKTKDLQCQ